MTKSIQWCWLLLVACSAARTADTDALRLSIKDAEQLALKNHPRISASELEALASNENVREARSAYFPTLAGNLTAAGNGGNNTRIAAGALNNPVIYERAAVGVIASQLITDFGRTANLVATSKFRAKADTENVDVSRAQILALVDSAYYAALGAKAVLRVSEDTAASRKLLSEQVGILASNKLKSELDASFARVSYQEGELLLSQSQNDLRAALTKLSTVLGYRDEKEIVLMDVQAPTNALEDASQLTSIALGQRPDLVRLRYERDAAVKFSKAEGALFYPTLSAVATAGNIPIHGDNLPDNYAAAGVNLNIPLFEGFNYSARKKEAELRARALDERVREAENDALRDVRVAWLNVNNAMDRFRIERSLVENAEQAYALADARYHAGSSGIVELSQALVNRTTAEIGYATARYELLIQRALLDFQTGRSIQNAKTP
jgi:outer membrane protein